MHGHKSMRSGPLSSFIYLRADRASLSLSIIVDPGISFGLVPPRCVFYDFKFYNCRKAKRAHIRVFYKKNFSFDLITNLANLFARYRCTIEK